MAHMFKQQGWSETEPTYLKTLDSVPITPSCHVAGQRPVVLLLRCQVHSPLNACLSAGVTQSEYGAIITCHRVSPRPR